MSSSLILHNNNEQIGLWHKTKNGFYMITSNNQLCGWTKKKPQSTFQSQTCTKKLSRSLFGGLLPVWPTAAFWILVKPLHLRGMLSKSMRYTKNCNAFSWHWSTEWPQFFSMTMPNCMLHNQCFKSWMKSGHKVLSHLPYSSDFSPTDYHFFKHFDKLLQEKCYHNQQDAENAFQEFIKSLSTDFLYATGINKFIPHWQNCADSLRWQRNRTGRPLSPPQIHQKIIWMLSKLHKTTSEHWQRTPGTQKGSPLSRR